MEVILSRLLNRMEEHDLIGLINTSMSRLSMLIDRAEQNPERDKIFDSNLFKRDFAELMRQTQALYDNLRLYNEQLMEAQKTAQ